MQVTGSYLKTPAPRAAPCPTLPARFWYLEARSRSFAFITACGSADSMSDKLPYKVGEFLDKQPATATLRPLGGRP
jgi:hypothetical protein